MKNITCPNCKTAFKIDESNYESIAKQVRDTEFNFELNQRLDLAAKEKEDALQLQKSELRSLLAPTTQSTISQMQKAKKFCGLGSSFRSEGQVGISMCYVKPSSEDRVDQVENKHLSVMLSGIKIMQI